MFIEKQYTTQNFANISDGCKLSRKTVVKINLRECQKRFRLVYVSCQKY